MLIKLAGNVEADPDTGQLTVRWTDLPQLPIGEMRLSLFGGERALLVTPAAMWLLRRSKHAHAVERHARGDADLDPSKSPPGPTAARARAGVSTRRSRPARSTTRRAPRARSRSTLSRADGEQRFGAFTVTLPRGCLGSSATSPPARNRGIARGNARRPRQIGAATVGVGPGADPFYLPEPGRQASGIYLTGSYRRALPSG